ncbi:MAG: hypothetical protein AB7L92_04440, partial [Alphaproteobacteria bacterium]
SSDLYARNLLAGHGLTWNPGEAVEGYSNFLFTLGIAFIGRLGVDLQLASVLISFASYFAMLLLLWRYVEPHYRQNFANTSFAYAHRINRTLCVALTASSAIVLAWCFGGLEAVMFAMLLTASVCPVMRWLENGATTRQAFFTGMLFALAAMTRLEGLIVWGITGLFLGVLWLLKRNPHITFTRLLWLAVGFLILFAPYMGWRLWYFGDWLPNTYYAKVYGIPSDILRFLGFFYFLQFMILPPMLPVFAVVLLFLAWRVNALPHTLAYLFVIVTALTVQIINSGGDHMYYLRFCVPLVPLLALMIYHANSLIIPRNEKHFRDVCGALLVLLVFQFGMVRTDESFSPGAISGKSIAPYISGHWEEGTVIAINPAGALPYYAPDFRYIDMIGLMNPEIAQRSFLPADDATRTMLNNRSAGHHKGDGQWVLSQQPDYIIFGNAVWGTEKPTLTSDTELDALPEFHEQYEQVITYVNPPTDMLPALQYMAEQNAKAYNEARNKDSFVRGPVMNEKGQLRLIFWRRIPAQGTAL